MEEVELMARGRVDGWRVDRTLAYQNHYSDKPISVFEFCPLWFDEELKEEIKQAEQKEAEEINDENRVIYMDALANNYFNRPIEDFFNGR